MVTNNETRIREAQFSQHCIMEISCFRYFKLQFVFRLRGIHFDMASQKTNSARSGLIKRVYNISKEEKKDGKLSYLQSCSKTQNICDKISL